MAAAKKSASGKYTVLVGMNYPVGDAEKRAEPGDVVTDLPAKDIAWLLEQGAITAEGSADVTAVAAPAAAHGGAVSPGGDD